MDIIVSTDQGKVCLTTNNPRPNSENSWQMQGKSFALPAGTYRKIWLIRRDYQEGQPPTVYVECYLHDGEKIVTE